ncbi:MAG: hypothetical protein H6624_16100 [Bdellovibrionaceae bacterium]|nr:hypothetical protein [Bdellovibrionales bacterium]MCB9085871.1 hypothetical protein [Pseudobdellovibrionaceae bacterium]
MTRSKIQLCLLLFVLSLTQTSWGKDLYMTIRRDFGPKETPEVEINYKSDAPVTFRLLKPKDMAGFIASQIDLRRAWKQPKTEVNSARYLIQGFNKLKMDTGWVRGGLNQDLKVSLKPNFGGGTFRSTPSPLALGPKQFIATPDGFTVVQEFTSVPESQDEGKPFDVPGFNWWNPHRESALKTRVVHLPKLDPGFYVLQVIQQALEGQVVLAINDIVGRLEQTSHEALVSATTRDGEPLAGAKVRLRNIQGQWVGEETTDKGGTARFKTDSPQLIATIEKTGTAIIDTDFFASTAISPDLYLYTDRPMFKSGEKVRYRGVLREQHSGVSQLMGQTAARVRIVDIDDGQTLGEVPVTISDFGTFHGEFTLNDDQASGVYRLEASVDDKAHIGEFRVKDYVKPVFFVKIDTSQETLKPGSQLTATIKAERYAGGAPPDVVYRAQLFRAKADTPQWVEDAGMGESGSEVTYFWDQTPNQYNPLTLLTTKDELKLNRNGIGVLTLAVPSDTPVQSNFDYKYMLKISAEDADGNQAGVSKTFLDMKSELIAQARMTASFAGQGFPASLKVRSVYPSGKAYANARGQVQWTVTSYDGSSKKLDDRVFKTDENGRFEMPVPTENPGAIQARVYVWDKNDAPSRADVEMLVLNPDIRQGVVRVQDMTLLSRRDYFFPGETSKGLVMLPEGWGHHGGNKGTLYITVAGEKIFSHRVQAVDGLATWIEEKIQPEFGTGVYIIVAYADPTRGWVERKFSYRIPQKDKQLRVKMAFAQGNVMPGQEQTVNLTVVDDGGRPVHSEVSLSVVDTAVLALQPEFRPQLMDFFYPQAKLNLTSFFSSQFQSYGYGEPLATLFKPNYWYSAAKSEQEKLREDDTAHWVANLITDDQGAASTTFRMPANQTIWEVTAIAVDKNGRFGESKDEFRSQMPVSLILAMPAFLRRGDSMEPRISISNTKDSGQTYEVSYQLDTPTELKVETPMKAADKLTPGKSVDLVGNALLAQLPAEGKSISLTSQMQFAQNSLKFEHSLRTMDSRIPSYESPPETESGWKLSQSEQSPIQSVRYVVTQGIMGTLMPSMRWLIAYPHGCVEQSLSRTIPSLVMKDLFEGIDTNKSSVASTVGAVALPTDAGFIAKAWNWFKGLWMRFMSWFRGLFQRETIQIKIHRTFSKLVGDAQEFASAGLKKLALYQNRNGAFSWFAGEGEGDLDMTLTVMMMLMSHEKPFYKSDGLDLEKSWSWINQQYIDRNSERGIILTYIQARLHKAGTVQSGRSDAVSRINQIGARAKDLGLGLQALTLLALDSFGLRDTADAKATQQLLIANLQGGVTEFFNNGGTPQLWRPLRASWQGYPGNFLSDVAIAVRALHSFAALDNNNKSSYITMLLRQFNGSHFGSTYETSMVLLHSSWLLQEDMNRKASDRPPTVRIDGQAIVGDKIRTLSSLSGWELEVDGSLLTAGDHTFEADRDKYLSADLRLVRMLPIEQSAQQSQGWELKKSYYKIENGGHLRRPFDPTKEGVRVGDLLFVELDFGHRMDGQGWRQMYSPSHFILHDDVPAGFLALEEDKEFSGFAWYDPDKSKGLRIRRIEQDRIYWYFRYDDRWMSKTRKVGYFLRANYGGIFSSGVARVEDFYDENSFAQTAGSRLRVAPYQR